MIHSHSATRLSWRDDTLAASLGLPTSALLARDLLYPPWNLAHFDTP